MTRPSIRWLRVALCGAASVFTAFAAGFLVVAVYATFLGFRAMGPPDPAKIQAFAGAYAPWIGGVAAAVATFVFALLAARRQALRLLHGLLTGAVAALLSLAVTLAFGSPSPADALGFAIYVVAGAAAGWLSARRAPASEVA